MFHSKVTEKGNSSYSFFSQEEAESRARFLDENNCINCINCIDCKDCKDCTNCINCPSQPIQIRGLPYNLYIRADSMVIGCQDHPIFKWVQMSEFDYLSLDYINPEKVKSFVSKYKSIILALLSTKELIK